MYLQVQKKSLLEDIRWIKEIFANSMIYIKNFGINRESLLVKEKKNFLEVTNEFDKISYHMFEDDKITLKRFSFLSEGKILRGLSRKILIIICCLCPIFGSIRYKSTKHIIYSFYELRYNDVSRTVNLKFDKSHAIMKSMLY